MAYSLRGWKMSGSEEKQVDAFRYSSMEDRIPARRPIRPFKEMVNEILRDMDDDFDGLSICFGLRSCSFQPKEDEKGGSRLQGGDRNPDVNFRGQTRSNDTHESKTDGDAPLYKKSKGLESKLAYLWHVLMENRNGLSVDVGVPLAGGAAERDAAKTMAGRLPGRRRRVLGPDKGYDAVDFATDLREIGITPHIVQKKGGKSADGRTTRHEG